MRRFVIGMLCALTAPALAADLPAPPKPPDIAEGFYLTPSAGGVPLCYSLEATYVNSHTKMSTSVFLNTDRSWSVPPRKQIALAIEDMRRQGSGDTDVACVLKEVLANYRRLRVDNHNRASCEADKLDQWKTDPIASKCIKGG